MPKAVKASDTVVHHPKNRHMAEKFESLISILMVIAIAGLLVGLVYGVMMTGTGTPSWMR
jgi:hypothetical protein